MIEECTIDGKIRKRSKYQEKLGGAVKLKNG
jgi:hypothetical protein